MTPPPAAMRAHVCGVGGAAARLPGLKTFASLLRRLRHREPPASGHNIGAVGNLLKIGALLLVLSPLSAGLAVADPLPVADVSQSADTDDGWHLSVALANMTINSVPNMAATAFTREGFVTGKAVATIDGNGDIPVNSGTLVFGLQLGCQIDLSEGASLSAVVMPASASASGNTITSLTEGPYADVNGNVSVNLLPGTITNLGLGHQIAQGAHR